MFMPDSQRGRGGAEFRDGPAPVTSDSELGLSGKRMHGVLADERGCAGLSRRVLWALLAELMPMSSTFPHRDMPPRWSGPCVPWVAMQATPCRLCKAVPERRYVPQLRTHKLRSFVPARVGGTLAMISP